MILGENGEKMSKSRGNVINPDDIVESHGADSLRVYEMFMGPLEAALPWNPSGLDGTRKWLDRVWRCIAEQDKLSETNDHSLDKSYHFTVKKVTHDITTLNFNTAVSQMMIFINDCFKAESIYIEYAKGFVKLFSAFAPHMGEELWQLLGATETIAYAPWPTYDEAMLVEDEIEVIVQVNGKLRGKIVVALGTDTSILEEKARNLPAVLPFIEGKPIRKIISVKDKLVNIVV
jgi:leucyl-tRNA synthetase